MNAIAPADDIEFSAFVETLIVGAGACGLTAALAVQDAGGEALVLSQFTVMADTTRGRRPNFSHAAAPESARELYAAFAEALGQQVPTVAGPFASRLMVDARNRGPFTLPLEL